MLREDLADPGLRCLLGPVAFSATHSNHTAPDVDADESQYLFLCRLRPPFLSEPRPQLSNAFGKYVARARRLCSID